MLKSCGDSRPDLDAIEGFPVPVAPEILIWVLFGPVGALERAGMANSHGRHARVIRCPAAMLKSFARIGAGPVQREVVSDRHGAVMHDKEQGRVQAATHAAVGFAVTPKCTIRLHSW